MKFFENRFSKDTKDLSILKNSFDLKSELENLDL